MALLHLHDAWSFYSEYAMEGGFEPIKSTSKPPPGRSTDVVGMVKLKFYTCARASNKRDTSKKVDDKQGEPASANGLEVCNDGSVGDVVEEVVKKVRPRKTSSKKIGCLAQIKLSIRPDGKYVVYQFHEEHNHYLVHPDFMKHLNAFRKLGYSRKRLLHGMNDAGVGATVGHRILSKVCGAEDIGFTKSEAKNYKRDVNAFMTGCDCQIVVDLLEKKKASLPDFSIAFFTEPNKEIAGLFWADELAKRNYSAFGDVVSFDATYRTNKYDMVFIPFTGVDNHMRCVTFGAGLLSKENVTSYKWLLKSFLEAFPVPPKMILTDQDPSMKIAVQAVFPSSRHRLCMWHIMDKVSTKVPISVCNNGFKESLSRIVWTDKLESSVFDSLWASIIDEYGLHDNRWLSDMFNLRKYWIPAYFRDWELSGLMRTSSRSESENHMFNQLMSSSNILVEFLTHFDTAMQEQRFKQSSNDHDSFYKIPDFKYDWLIEQDAARLFTIEVFYDFAREIGCAIHRCMSLSYCENGDEKRFCIVDTSVTLPRIDYSIDRVKEPKKFDEFFPKNSEVVYNSSSGAVYCSCKRFERFGFPCRHMFYVLRACQVNKIPINYIFKRWLKNVVPHKVSSYSSNNVRSLDMDSGLREIIQRIQFNVDAAVDKVVGNKEKLLKLLKSQERILEDVDNDFEESDQMGNKEFISEMLGVQLPENINVLAPTNIRNKGCGLKKRITSSREQAIAKKVKKSRACGVCGSHEKHNSRTCPQRKPPPKKDGNGPDAAGTSVSQPENRS